MNIFIILKITYSLHKYKIPLIILFYVVIVLQKIV
jgi:hypothetical protein